MPLAEYQAQVRKEKRTALLDAAQAAFLARGFARSSVNAIAKDAGVSTATLYKHFDTKEDLFGAVTGRMWQALRSRLDLQALNAAPLAEALHLIGSEYAELLERDDVRGLFRVIVAEAVQFPELGKKLYEHGKGAYLNKLERYLAQRVAAGELAIDDVGLATRQFLGMISDIVLWPSLLVAELKVSAKERDKVVRTAAETFLARYRNET